MPADIKTSIVEKDYYGQAIKIHIVDGKDLYSFEEVGKLLGFSDDYQWRAYKLYKRHIDELEQYIFTSNLEVEGEEVKNLFLTREGVWGLWVLIKMRMIHRVCNRLKTIEKDKIAKARAKKR